MPHAPKHVELIDGALIFRLLPQRFWCSSVTTNLVQALEQAAPAGFDVARQMTVRLDRHSRTEPDALVTTAPEDELDVPTGDYVPTGIHRDRLKLSVPFPLDIDLAALTSA